MANLFKDMNRKQRRSFNKLNVDEKETTLWMEMQRVLSEHNTKITSNAFVNGYLSAFPFLYNKYLVDYDFLNDEAQAEVCKNLIAEICKGNDVYNKKFVERSIETDTNTMTEKGN